MALLATDTSPRVCEYREQSLTYCHHVHENVFARLELFLGIDCHIYSFLFICNVTDRIPAFVGAEDCMLGLKYFSRNEI